MASRDELLSYLAPIVHSASAVLEDVTITPAGRSRVISVIVDSESHNLSLDEVTGISRKVSEALKWAGSGQDEHQKASRHPTQNANDSRHHGQGQAA